MKIKKNIITAKGVSGIYKDKDIDIIVNDKSEDCKVLVNGKDISGRIFGVHLHIRAGERTKIVLEKVHETS